MNAHRPRPRPYGDRDADPSGTDRLSVLVFEAAGRRYALPAADVQEMQRAVTIVPLPGAPEIVEGVIDLRGALVPVLDIRKRFGLAPKEVEPGDHLVVAWAGARRVALRVDRAHDLAAIDPRDVEDPQSVAPAARYLAGIARLPGGLVLIHDLRAFLSQAEAASLDQAFPRPDTPEAAP
jgi:purine-binding chemotaxis protein CheW